MNAVAASILDDFEGQTIEVTLDDEHAIFTQSDFRKEVHVVYDWEGVTSDLPFKLANKLSILTLLRELCLQLFINSYFWNTETKIWNEKCFFFVKYIRIN